MDDLCVQKGPCSVGETEGGQRARNKSNAQTKVWPKQRTFMSPVRRNKKRPFSTSAEKNVIFFFFTYENWDSIIALLLVSLVKLEI